MTELNPLKRSLSLTLLTFYGLGTILGAGIYVLVGKVALHAGPYVPVAFLIAALLTVFTALSYAELAARYPKSGGAAVYMQAGFHRQRLSVFVGFLLILTGMVSAATLVNGFVGYLHVFTDMPAWLVSALLVRGMGALAAWGIAESVAAAALITLIELGGLIFILVVTGEHLAELPARLPELVPPADWHVWNGIFLGAFLAFYAFIGFEDLANVVEEAKVPQRDIPRAMVLTLVISSALYLAVAAVAVLAVPVHELAASPAPLALVFRAVANISPLTISAIAIVATLNTILAQLTMAARVIYGMARQGDLPRFAGRVHPTTATPLIATALIVAATLTLALLVPFERLAEATSLATLVVFALVNLSLLRLRHRQVHTPGPHVRVPLWVPAAGLAVCLAMMTAAVLG